MSDTPKRTSEDCKAKYNQLQFRLGGARYAIRQFEKDAALYEGQMLDLTLEYNQLQAQEQEANKIRNEFAAQLKAAKDRNPISEEQIATQPGSGASPTPVGPDGQNQKQE